MLDLSGPDYRGCMHMAPIGTNQWMFASFTLVRSDLHYGDLDLQNVRTRLYFICLIDVLIVVFAKAG